MSIWTKIILATLGVGTIGGATFAGYSHFSKNSFKDNLGESLLSLTGESNKAEWTARIKELAQFTSDLTESLSSLKTGKQWQDLQKWCFDNSSNKFQKEGDTNYLNFETFCTWKIGDKSWTKKISSDTAETDGKWGTAHTKLRDKTNLSSDLEIVKNTVAKNSDNADKKAMHKWCTDSYKKTWKNNKTFKEVEDYCQA